MLFYQSVHHCEPLAAVSCGEVASASVVRLVHQDPIEELADGGGPVREQARRVRINDFEEELANEGERRNRTRMRVSPVKKSIFA